MMMKSRKQYAREANVEKRKLNGGKLKPKEVKKTLDRYYYLKRRADGIIYQRPKRSAKSRKSAFNPQQGFLENFLPQQSLVRIEELVADKMFKQLNNKEVDTKLIEKSLSKAMRSKRLLTVLKRIDRENKKRKSA